MSSFNMSISAFPVTVIGIPIATVCPPGTTSTISSARLAIDLGSDSTESFQFISLPTTSLIASSMITASAKLPDGSMTAFSSLIRRETEMEAVLEVPFVLPDGKNAISLGNNTSDDNAVGKVLVGSEGCQTLYTPTTTAICYTVISPIGLPPVTVTDCSQYVTFSSETAYTCAPTSDITPLPAGSSDGNTLTYSPLSASITTIPTTSVSTVPSVDLAGSIVGGDVGPVDVVNSITTDAALDLPTITDFPSTGSGTTGSGSLLSRRALVYTSAPNDDIPMSLPRQLWPEETPSKKQVPANIRKRQIESIGGFNITIVRHMVTQENADSTPKPSALDAHTTSQPVNTSVQGNIDMSMTPTISDTESLPQVTDIMTEGNVDMSMTATISDAPSLPLATDLADMATQPDSSVNVDPNILDIDSMPQTTEDMTVTPVPTVSGLAMSTASDMAASALSDIDMPTTSDLSSSGVSDASASMTSDLLFTSDSTAASVQISDVTGLPIHAIQLSSPQPTKYYAAPWYQLTGAFGAVPTNVKGIKCYGGVAPPESCVSPDRDGDNEPCGCDIDDEIWSVLSLTQTKIGTTVVSYDGSVVVTASGQTLTTSVNFTQTLTTTREVLVGGIVKSTILATSASDDATVYATQTTFPSVTMTMLPGDGVPDNSTLRITAGSQGSSNVVDAAAPQSSPGSISTLTSVSTADSLVASETSAMNAEIDGTTFVTSIVATETVTMPPSDAVAATKTAGSSLSKPTVAPIPDLTDNSVSGVESSAVGSASLAARDDWPTYMWMVDTDLASDAAETKSDR